MGWRLSFLFKLEKRIRFMDIDLYIRNLELSITVEELRTLFEKAGEVIHVNLPGNIKGRQAQGFAFITMSIQSEADKAVSMFNAYSMKGFPIEVSLTKPRKQRGFESAS
jgi:polyadenylate-binding protein